MQGDDVTTSSSVPQAGHLVAAVFSSGSDAVVVVDGDGAIVLSSAAVTDLFGYYPEELVGEPIELLVPNASRGAHVTHRKRFVEASRARQMGTGLQLYGMTRDGIEVPVDVSLAPAEVGGRRYVAAFVRDARERVRNVRQLEAVGEVTRQLLAGASLDDTVTLTLQRAAELVDASSSWLVTPAPGGGLVVSAAAGDGAERLLGTRLAGSGSLAARVLASGELGVIGDLVTTLGAAGPAVELRLGPAVYVPLVSEAGPTGVLVVARRQGEPGFEPGALNVIRLFSAAAAVALALGGARHELERLRLIEEDERIARDLHDTIVQRAFAVGMSLDAVRQLTSGPVLDRIDTAVRGLDDMIRDLRNAIFRLSHPLEAGTTSARVTHLVDELTGQLGFAPRVAIRGPVDQLVPVEVTAELLRVLREAVSNVARHARASKVEVVLVVQDGEVVLAVTDDGVGIGNGPTAGNGLANMANRAEQLGGAFNVIRAGPAGTVLTWRVPLGA
jgi:PAS domain S-box-containing protein